MATIVQRVIKFQPAGSAVKRLLRVWDQADQTDFAEGMLAYTRYRETLARIADHYHTELPRVVGAFAALSPNNSYLSNLRSLIAAIEGRRGAGYTACHERAMRCLYGENFLDFTVGKKTRSFYMNIMDPMDPEPVTIDGHMYGCWLGERVTMREAAEARWNYDAIANDFREAASEIGNWLLPNQLQAVLWFTWKRINNVIFDPQMDLMRLDDQWGLDRQPWDI